MTFSIWFKTLLSEKGIDVNQYIEVNGASGANQMPLSMVVDAVLSTGSAEQAGIKDMLVRIDYAGASVIDYLKHLAQALAK